MNKQRHLILTNSRSGSTYFTQLLNSSSEVVNYGEIYLKKTWIKKYSACLISEKISSIYSSRYLLNIWLLKHYKNKHHLKLSWNVKTIGVKEFYRRLLQRGGWEYVKDNPDIRIIHMYRDNLLKRMVSLDNLAVTRVVIDDGTYEHKKLLVDVPQLLDRLEAAEQLFSDQKHGLDAMRNPIYEICYEDLFSDHEVSKRITQELFEFLGVGVPEKLFVGKKVLSDRLEDVVENYDELADAVSKTRFSKFLH